MSAHDKSGKLRFFDKAQIKAIFFNWSWFGVGRYMLRDGFNAVTGSGGLFGVFGALCSLKEKTFGPRRHGDTEKNKVKNQRF